MMRDQTQPATVHDADLALARAATQGDVAARRQVADRLLDRTRITVRCLVGPDPDADDIVQLCLIRVLRSLGTYEGRSRLEHWADRIVVRRALRLVQRARPRRRREVQLEEPPEQGTAPGELEDRLTRQEIWRRLAHQLQRLTPERRVVVLLRLVHDHPVAEIAEITGAPLNTVRDRLRVGRKQLRKMIAGDPVLAEWMETRR